MGGRMDQVVVCGLDASVRSVEIVWAPSRGGSSSIGGYSLKVVGGISRGG